MRQSPLIQGYKISQEISRIGSRVVYHAEREEDRVQVLIKTFRAEIPSRREISELEREFEIIRSISARGAPKSYLIEKSEKHPPALVMEGVSGVSLRLLMDSNKIDIRAFLQLASRLAEILGEIHSNNVVLRNISPDGIFVNPETEDAWFIDFSDAMRATGEIQQFEPTSLRERELAYISPEQTGRMGRPLDWRTDFYSLGTVFYEMLTGAPPFKSSEPMETVHSHIAKTPHPPSEIKPEIPLALSNIVMKMLAKNAEDRYKSAYGLLHDLTSCLDAWKRSKDISGIVPGERDFCDRLRIPQKLYGRDAEFQALMSAFEGVSGGSAEMVLVSGYSGVGKSALVAEARKAINERGGYFISGKYDRNKSDIPYSGVIEALRELIGRTLTESNERIQDRARDIDSALGANARVLMEILPELKLVIGNKPPVLELPAQETQNRFHLVFGRFVRVFARHERPLTVFLDDLQWADTATLKLIQALAKDEEIVYFLLVGAYRSNEVADDSPFASAVSQIEQTGAKLSRLPLTPLDIDRVEGYIADAFGCEIGAATPLAALAHKKTKGNPFFMVEFLKMIYESRLASFDYAERRWLFDIERISLMPMTDNVIDLMASKVIKLRERSRRMAQLASCVGSRFDLETLALINNDALEKIVEDLNELMEEGLALPISDFGDNSHGFKFLHDRVWQAAYSLLSTEKAAELHLQLACALREKLRPSEAEERIFEIANHFNLGGSIIGNDKTRAESVDANIRAAKRAKLSGAYESARIYYQYAMKSMPDDSWLANYNTTLFVHLEAALCEHISGDGLRTEALLRSALDNATSDLDRARIMCLQTGFAVEVGDIARAIGLGISALNLIGVKFPEDPQAWERAAETETALLRKSLMEIKVESLINAPTLTDPKGVLAVDLLFAIGPAVYQIDENLLYLIGAKIFEVSLSYGCVDASACQFGATVLVKKFEDYKLAAEFGELAIRLADKPSLSHLKSRLVSGYGYAVGFWHNPMESVIPYLWEGYTSGVEHGDLQYAGYNRILHCQYLFLKGEPLKRVLAAIEDTVNFVHKSGNPFLVEWATLMSQAPKFLRDSEGDTGFTADDSAQYMPPLIADTFYSARLQTCYLFGDYKGALETLSRRKKIEWVSKGTYLEIEYRFYQSLTLSATYFTGDEAKRREIRSILNANLLRFKNWTSLCSANFIHKCRLLEAETKRLAGDFNEAEMHYESAVDSAREYGFTHIEAIGNELAARHFQTSGDLAKAGGFFAAALRVYEKWGAHRKAQDIIKKYSPLISTTSKERLFVAPLAENISSSSELDMQSVIKASQAISEEIVLSRLIEKLMKIAIQNAGAERGALLLEKNGKMRIEAEGAVAGKTGEIAVLLPDSAEITDETELPATIINYVSRTSLSVVFSESIPNDKFAADSYISRRKPKSVLAVPIINQGRIRGILYFENKIASDAFTEDRIRLMQVLSSQAAISIENAELYREVERLKNRLQIENVYLQEEIKDEHNFHEIIGHSQELKKTLKELEQVAPTDATVLIFGETGTGKELLARAIHNLSARKDRPLVKVNCGAIASGLVESELFGHEKGAFTGALSRRLGRFELADGGTIFLDEVSELPPDTQVKLLRVLQEGEFERIGSSHTIRADVRVIAATNQNLKGAVKSGSFRSDLFYRLSVFPLNVPSLRERNSDIPLLVNFFVSKFARKLRKPIEGVSKEAMNRLANYAWPGNIRELQNILERAAVITQGAVINIDEIALESEDGGKKNIAVVNELEEVERLHILRVLEETDWVVEGKRGAAVVLKINPSTLRFRMKKLGIKKPRRGDE